MLRFRLRLPDGSQTVIERAPEATFSDLLAAASTASGGRSVELLSGFPPTPLAHSPATPLATCFRSGESYIVRASADPSAPKAAATAAPPPTPAAAGETRVLRRVIPADNSCLFHAFAYALEGGRAAIPCRAPSLRAIAAAAVLAQPEIYSEAVLGRPPREYAAWIAADEHWGGALELALLSAHFNVEVAAFDVVTGRVDVYGEGEGGRASRMLLVYDGLHYDLLVSGSGVADAPEEFDVCCFAVDDVATLALVMGQAAEVVAAARAARAFTDTARFTIRCLVCQQGLAGEQDAVAHAQATGHTNFSEYK